MFACIRTHQEVVEESFLPTVLTLMNAPATSPLAEVDINNVVELLVELTRPSALIKPSTNTEVSCELFTTLRSSNINQFLQHRSSVQIFFFFVCFNSQLFK